MVEQDPSFGHLIHWVQDLDAAMAAYDELGLPTRTAPTMPGCRNAAWGVDDARYVEPATVDDWEAVAGSPYAEGVELLRPAVEAAGGEGPVTFAVDVRDAREVAAGLEAAGRGVSVVEVRFEAGSPTGLFGIAVRGIGPSAERRTVTGLQVVCEE